MWLFFIETVTWYQVILSKSNNLQTDSCGPLLKILPGTTTVSQSEPGSNGNEQVLHIPQISRTWVSPSDRV